MTAEELRAIEIELLGGNTWTSLVAATGQYALWCSLLRFFNIDRKLYSEIDADVFRYIIETLLKEGDDPTK